jgi:hypothetical protein
LDCSLALLAHISPDDPVQSWLSFSMSRSRPLDDQPPPPSYTPSVECRDASRPAERSSSIHEFGNLKIHENPLPLPGDPLLQVTETYTTTTTIYSPRDTHGDPGSPKPSLERPRYARTTPFLDKELPKLPPDSAGQLPSAPTRHLSSTKPSYNLLERPPCDASCVNDEPARLSSFINNPSSPAVSSTRSASFFESPSPSSQTWASSTPTTPPISVRTL